MWDEMKPNKMMQWMKKLNIPLVTIGAGIGPVSHNPLFSSSACEIPAPSRWKSVTVARPTEALLETCKEMPLLLWSCNWGSWNPSMLLFANTISLDDPWFGFQIFNSLEGNIWEVPLRLDTAVAMDLEERKVASKGMHARLLMDIVPFVRLSIDDWRLLTTQFISIWRLWVARYFS